MSSTIYGCQALLGSFYDTHRTLVPELGRVLADLTDPQKVKELRERLDQEVANPKPVPPIHTIVESPPNSSNHLSYSPNTYIPEHEPWEVSSSSSPTENST